MTKVFQINSMHLSGWTIEAKKPLHATLNKVLFQDAEFNGFCILDGRSGYHPAPLIMAICGELKGVLPEHVCDNYSYIPIARYLQDYFDQTWGRLPLTCQRLKKGVNGINPGLRQFLSQIDFVNDFNWQADLADTSAFNGIDHLFSMLIDHDCLPDSIEVKTSPNTGEITMYFSRPAANTPNRGVDSTIVFRRTSDKTLSFDIEPHLIGHALQKGSVKQARVDANMTTRSDQELSKTHSKDPFGLLTSAALAIKHLDADTILRPANDLNQAIANPHKLTASTHVATISMKHRNKQIDTLLKFANGDSQSIADPLGPIIAVRIAMERIDTATKLNNLVTARETKMLHDLEADFGGEVSIAVSKSQAKARKPTTQQLKRYKQLCNLSAWHAARGTQMPKHLLEEASNMCLHLDMPD